MTDKTLYEALTEAGVPTSSHRSDLYFKKTIRAETILSQYPHLQKMSGKFRNTVDNDWWIDVPFAYDPFWNERDPLAFPFTDEKLKKVLKYKQEVRAIQNLVTKQYSVKIGLATIADYERRIDNALANIEAGYQVDENREWLRIVRRALYIARQHYVDKAENCTI